LRGTPEPPADTRQPQVDVELDKDLKRLVERSTAAQGLPFHVQDQAVLARVAALIRAMQTKDAGRRAS
jgi:hypothetical protein